MQALLARNANLRYEAAARAMKRLADERRLTPERAAQVVRYFRPLRCGSYSRVFVSQDAVSEDHNQEMTGVVLSLRTAHSVEQGECIPLHHGPREERKLHVTTQGARAVVLQLASNYFEVVRPDDPVLRYWLRTTELSRDVRCGYNLSVDEKNEHPDAVVAPVVSLPLGAACCIVGAALVMCRSMAFNTTMPGLFDGHPIECSI